MLVLTATKTKLIKLARSLGYDPPKNSQFTKLFRSRTWWLEWGDGTGFYSAILDTAAGRAFFGVTFDDGENPKQWKSTTLPLAKLREFGLVEERKS